MKKRVKMVDIARAANVSRTAVSLILNQVPGVRVAEATRQRVLQVARELGYSPGPVLADFDPDRLGLYGVLINEISSAYPIDVIYGLQNRADANAVQIVIQVTDGSPDHERAALANFKRFGVQGVVFASTFSNIVTPPEELATIRHVFLNCRREDRAGLSVLPAERHGGALAAQHLIDLGCQCIATITGDPWQFATRERLAGYHRALNSAELNLGPNFERSSDWGHSSGYAAAIELLRRSERPDGLFCHNDIIARGALEAAQELGFKVPEDLAIIGYDDREFAKDMGITSVTLPYAEMAERALVELAKGGSLNDRVISVSGRLIVRKSSDRGLFKS